MKLEVTKQNYCATIVKVDKLMPADNSDNLALVNMFGYTAVVGKDLELGKLYIFFTTESQLSEVYLYNNNLYRKVELNKSPDKKGYMESNGRIRAVKLRGNNSNALIMPLSSLSYLGINYNELREGDMFNVVNGVSVVTKYEIVLQQGRGGNKIKGVNKKYERIDGRGFPEHFETDQYFRNEHKYAEGDRLIITQKLHGTSARIANLRVSVKPTLIDKLLRRQRYEYDYLAGSRRVIKDLKSDRDYQHFHKTEGLDIYNRVLNEYKNVIPKDTIIYGEVIGYLDNTPIQKGYTYDCLPGQWKFYVYRISSINSDSLLVDYSWDAIKEFCNKNGLNYVPELEVGFKANINVNDYMDIRYHKNLVDDDYNEIPLPLSDSDSVDEGVCIRREGILPYITKAKSPKFYEYETKQLDSGEVDLESAQ